MESKQPNGQKIESRISLDDDSDDIEPMKMGIIKHRNSGLAVSEVSGNNLSSELIKSEEDMIFQQK